MKHMKQKRSYILLFVLVLLIGCKENSDQVIRFKMGLVDPENSNYGMGAKRISQEVSNATSGKIIIDVFGSGQLGNERDMYEGAQLGTVDIATIANPVLTSFIPEMAILDQPFLFETEEQAHNVIDGELGELIKQKALEQGIHIVGWMESGFRNCFSIRPIKNLSDFKNLKIRTMENATQIAVFESFGAIPTPMPATEQYTALQQRTIDAGENAIANVLANKYYEVVKNITLTRHQFVFIAIGLSDKAWNRIPDELKPVFVESVKEGANYQRALLSEANAEAEVELKEIGVTFYNIDRNELKNSASQKMVSFTNRIPKDWIDASKILN
ncbi:TRAP transporter substrate-binding protein [Brachyspira catarrhinii]|uniref:TRAP transporter substrate-binding protein n=1 Tax=Brachyspira catarrhinii TaxID=2528966 RepID=A0ABY2TU80_9SPIR|nr:TRAP transporter substrate-binding protein [Brachyspira catarrhinii]TKZ36453.1 TRAP transporter substrate-binding protein [Brachyspira catarrhinii]